MNAGANLNGKTATQAYADSYALCLIIFQRSKAVPKAQRPTLGRGLEEAALNLLFAIQRAGFARDLEGKKELLKNASDALDRLRTISQLCKDLCFFSDSSFFEISERSAVVGRQLGGWLRS